MIYMYDVAPSMQVIRHCKSQPITEKTTGFTNDFCICTINDLVIRFKMTASPAIGPIPYLLKPPLNALAKGNDYNFFWMLNKLLVVIDGIQIIIYIGPSKGWKEVTDVQPRYVDYIYADLHMLYGRNTGHGLPQE